MAEIKCPSCARDFVRRVSRAGWFEVFLSLFRVYPFKCQLCGERFRYFQPGVSYSRAEKDRREYDRMEAQCPVSFRNQDSAGGGTLLDVSMGGCTFATDDALEAGTILQIDLHVLPELAPVIIDAAVVRNVVGRSAGVEFLRWRPTERERLQLFVRGMLIGRGQQPDIMRKVS